MVNHANLSDAEVYHLLHDINGPVGHMLQKMTADMAVVAIAKAPVREGNVWSEATTTAHAPGYTKASIHPVVKYDRSGNLFGSVNAMANPTIFLEDPAEQMHRKHPFLSTALWTTTLL